MKNSTLWTIFGMLLTLLALFYTYLYLRPILDTALTLVIVAVVVAIAAGAGAVIVIAVNQSEASREKRLTLRAERQVVEADARMRNAEAERVTAHSKIISTVTKPGEILHLTYLDQAHETSTTVLPTLAGSTHVNGRYVEPSAAEQRNWLTHQALYAPQGGGELPAPVHPLLEAGVSQPLPQRVNLKDYVSEPSLQNLFLGVGMLPDGNVGPVQMPLPKLTHIAVGGTSGFGKSVQLQCLAYQMLNAREGVNVTLLDAQGTTFPLFDDHPNLRYPIVSQENEIERVLCDVYGELERRNQLFRQWRGVANLDDYNRVANEPLPIFPLIFDEFGLVADNKTVAYYIKKIAQAGRKVGIFCVFAAQTWKASDISTTIRGNLATSIQFYARDKAQSRVLLGDSIAAEITRPGEAYASLPGVPGLVKIQAPLLDEQVAPTRRGTAQVIDLPEVEPEAETLAIEDEKFLKLVVEAGVSPSDACFRAYGKPYAGAQFYHCKDLLDLNQQA